MVQLSYFLNEHCCHRAMKRSIRRHLKKNWFDPENTPLLHSKLKMSDNFYNNHEHIFKHIFNDIFQKFSAISHHQVPDDGLGPKTRFHPLGTHF